MSKEQGTVKFFNSSRGWGFIRRSDGSDVFVHQSRILMAGYRTLEAGQAVEFETKQGTKSLEAENVIVLLPEAGAGR